MSCSKDAGTEAEDAAELARLASDWIALWQGELAAMGADPELTAAWGGWSANLAAWARHWTDSGGAGAAQGEMPGAMPGLAWPVPGWPGPSWPMAGWPPMPWAAPPPAAPPSAEPPPPASGPQPAPPEPPHDAAPRPASPVGASVAGPGPGLAGNGLDPLLERLDALERELARLRATLAPGEGGTRKDPAKPRRR